MNVICQDYVYPILEVNYEKKSNFYSDGCIVHNWFCCVCTKDNV
ncbi:MAG: hypothetical protein J6I73_04510 [Treponema sp.]|nr:hypothetical protein [Treponema sp.]